MSQPITLIRCRISVPKILGDGKTVNKLLTANIKVTIG